MAIHVAWALEDTAIHLKYSDPWGWPEMYKALGEAYALISDTAEPVPFIIDIRDSAKLPDGAIIHLGQMLRRAPRTVGKIIFVRRGESLGMTMARNILNVINDVYRLKRTYHFVDTLEQADEIIRSEGR